MIYIISILLFLHILQCLIIWAATFGFFQRKYCLIAIKFRKSDLRLATKQAFLSLFLIPPIGILLAYYCLDKFTWGLMTPFDKSPTIDHPSEWYDIKIEQDNADSWKQ